jgi:hypothetical protein
VFCVEDALRENRTANRMESRDVGVQFDAVLQMSSSLMNTHLTVFSRYWVSSNFFKIAVVWAEPHGRGLNFPIYPTTLSVTSTPEYFSVHHDIHGFVNGLFLRVRDESDSSRLQVFTNMYGDFPLDHLRSCEARANELRLDAPELANLVNSSGARSNLSSVIHMPRHNGGSIPLRVSMLESGFVRSIDFLDEDGEKIAGATYDYDPRNMGSLRSKTTEQHPRKVLFRLPVPAVVKTKTQTNYVQQFEGTDLVGGRKTLLQYRPTLIDGAIIGLPLEISVSSQGMPLRHSTLSRFKSTDLSHLDVELAASMYARFSPELKEYRALLERYWNQAVSSVTTEDYAAVKKLISFFEDHRDSSQTIGERLRSTNVLMELNRIIGDTDGLVLNYREYLTALFQDGLSETALEGGQTAVDTLILWGRYREANRVLDEWISACSQTVDLTMLLRFADRQIKRGNYWTTFRLLDSGSRSQVPINQQFELEGLRAISLKNAVALVLNSRSSENRGEAGFIATLNGNSDLENLADKAKARVRVAFRNLESPSAPQRTLFEKAAK